MPRMSPIGRAASFIDLNFVGNGDTCSASSIKPTRPSRVSMASLLPSMRVTSARLAGRSLRYTSRPFTTSLTSCNQGPGTGENREQANDPLPRKNTQNVSDSNATEVTAMGARDDAFKELTADAEKQRVLQAPNRSKVWSRNQQSRDVAMTGPRFEQTIMETQPQPYAAIELIHKQPVRWVDDKHVACDGGGGPLGHPKIFINLDKPQVCWCTYCGLPYANTHHRKHLESLPSTSYPLKPTGDPAQVQMPPSPSMNGVIQGEFPTLKGELEAENLGGQPYSQR